MPAVESIGSVPREGGGECRMCEYSGPSRQSWRRRRDWLHQERVKSVAIESTGNILDSLVRSAGRTGHRGGAGGCPQAQAGPRPEDRYVGLPVDPEATRMWTAGGLFPPLARDSGVASSGPRAGQPERSLGIGGAAHAEGAGLDEYQSSPSRDGCDGSDGNVDSTSHRGGRTRSSEAGPVERSSL